MIYNRNLSYFNKNFLDIESCDKKVGSQKVVALALNR